MEFEPPAHFRFLPPCQQGDVYLASLQKPAVIAIIDGYFDGVPSIWHKEILWALSQGIHVLGASSMGALRAAETHSFGMKGVGIVFDGFRTGDLEDDDEVALLHGPPEMDFMPLSVAMVNVRATLAAALEHDAISPALAERILTIAKSQFYKKRTWASIISECKRTPGANDLTEDQASWLSKNEVDQKQQDSLALCNILLSSDFSTPIEATFEFEETEFWHRHTRIWTKAMGQCLPDRDPGDVRLFT
ncbi:MAG: TfuA domain-containing protein [Roseibium sp.]|nr:TfuA domain-containing protein [Roseibium sp.]